MEAYHILELIGEGSFGKVYKGRRRFTGQYVALKFIPKRNKKEKDLEGLRGEIDILRRLNHENIILLLDAFETEKEFVMVTEFAQGEVFEILEDDGRLPEDQVRSIARQVVKALYYLHNHRVIHRDMKPQNILLSSEGTVKLCDFGFSRLLSAQQVMMTSIKGTPLYMAPELVREKPYDYRVDLWSLGVILYELFSGEPPFYTNDIMKLVKKITDDPLQLPQGASKMFGNFLEALLHKEPKQRACWPGLLEHPFVSETPEERQKRLEMEEIPQMPPRFRLEMLAHQGQSGRHMSSRETLGDSTRGLDKHKVIRRWVPVDPFSATFGEDSFLSDSEANKSPSVGREVVIVLSNDRKGDEGRDTGVTRTKRQISPNVSVVNAADAVNEVGPAGTEDTHDENSLTLAKTGSVDTTVDSADSSTDVNGTVGTTDFAPVLVKGHLEDDKASGQGRGTNTTVTSTGTVASGAVITTSVTLGHEVESASSMFGRSADKPIVSATSSQWAPTVQHTGFSTGDMSEHSDSEAVASSIGSDIEGEQLADTPHTKELKVTSTISVPQTVQAFWSFLRDDLYKSWNKCLERWTRHLVHASTFPEERELSVDMDLSTALLVLGNSGIPEKFSELCQCLPQDVYSRVRNISLEASLIGDHAALILFPLSLHVVAAGKENLDRDTLDKILPAISGDTVDELALLARDVLNDVKEGNGQNVAAQDMWRTFILSMYSIHSISSLVGKVESTALSEAHTARISQLNQALRRWYSEMWRTLSTSMDIASRSVGEDFAPVLCCLCHLGTQAAVVCQRWNEEGLCEFLSVTKASVNRMCSVTGESVGSLASFVRFVCLSGIAVQPMLNMPAPVKSVLLRTYCGIFDVSLGYRGALVSSPHIDKIDSTMLSSSVLYHVGNGCDAATSDICFRAALWQVDPTVNEDDYVAFLEDSLGEMSEDVFFELVEVLKSPLGTKWYSSMPRVWSALLSLCSKFFAKADIEYYGLLKTQALLSFMDMKHSSTDDSPKFFCSMLQNRQVFPAAAFGKLQHILAEVLGYLSTTHGGEGENTVAAVEAAVRILRLFKATIQFSLLTGHESKALAADRLASSSGEYPLPRLLYCLLQILVKLPSLLHTKTRAEAFMLSAELVITVLLCKSNEQHLRRWCAPPRLEVTYTTSHSFSLKLANLSLRSNTSADTGGDSTHTGILIALIHEFCGSAIVGGEDEEQEVYESLERLTTVCSLLCEFPLLYVYVQRRQMENEIVDVSKSSLLGTLEKKYPLLFADNDSPFKFVSLAYHRIGLVEGMGSLHQPQLNRSQCRQLLLRIQQSLYQIGAVRKLTSMVSTLVPSSDSAQEGVSLVSCQSVSVLLCRLCDLSTHFQNQLLRCFGLQVFFPLFRSPVAAAAQDTVLRTLTLISSLAQNSEESYPYLQNIDALGASSRLWCDDLAAIRAAFCRVVGNLCRHGDNFYAAIRSFTVSWSQEYYLFFTAEKSLHNILPSESGEITILQTLLLRCRDEDPTVRKWATFAIGNASFHGSHLYQEFAKYGAVNLLSLCIQDELDKSRVNAVGALGNFARHGSALDSTLASSGIPAQLWELFEDVRQNGQQNLPFLRIVLFALGNMVMYKHCRTSLLGHLHRKYNVEATSRRCIAFLEEYSGSVGNCDSLCKKYFDRIVKHIAQSSSVPSKGGAPDVE
eukprot:gb/GECG01013237.1/.p1 GENE.gb/GECG01013237.1/~~gb/GECG01013237.1/.p1  ORF type:complete len:1672 (+),score=171.85 gb/GECG01013237.1/:1-5016(+)